MLSHGVKCYLSLAPTPQGAAARFEVAGGTTKRMTFQTSQGGAKKSA